MRKYITYIAILTLFCGGLFFRCASIKPPEGGPKDSIPPVVVGMIPANKTTNFKSKRIAIEFNEYVQIKDQQDNFYTSPAMAKRPSVTTKGRAVIVDFKSDLDSATTYLLDFGYAIADNNEGNPYRGLRYIFSTGDHIDSLMMSGITYDAKTRDTVIKTFIFFFDAAADSVPEYDSLLFKSKPLVIARADSSGMFFSDILKDMDYKIYAIADKNGNIKYDRGADQVAFLDSTYNPTRMPPFHVWYDSLISSMVVEDPQLRFRLFDENLSRGQTLIESRRNGPQKLEFEFNAPHPIINSIKFFNLDSTLLIPEYSLNRDTMALWINAPLAEIPDSIKGEMVYMRTDSTQKLVPYTEKLSFNYRKANPKRKEKQVDSTEIKVEPLKFNVSASSTLNPETNIVFKFDFPLAQVDSSLIELTWKNEKKMVKQKAHLIQDSVNIRSWALTAPWKLTEKYELLIPAGVFRDITGKVNDTLKSEFTIANPDKFGTVIVNLKADSGKNYILQIADLKNNVISQKRFAGVGKHKFSFLEPEKRVLKIIEDVNKNGRWDEGNVVKRLQPETVALYEAANGSSELVIKSGWEVEYDVDANEIFGKSRSGLIVYPARAIPQEKHPEHQEPLKPEDEIEKEISDAESVEATAPEEKNTESNSATEKKSAEKQKKTDKTSLKKPIKKK